MKRINHGFVWQRSPSPRTSSGTEHTPCYCSSSNFTHPCITVAPPTNIHWHLVPQTVRDSNPMIEEYQGPQFGDPIIVIPFWNLIWSEREIHQYTAFHPQLISAGYRHRANIPKALYWIYHYRPLSEETVGYLMRLLFNNFFLVL